RPAPPPLAGTAAARFRPRAGARRRAAAAAGVHGHRRSERRAGDAAAPGHAARAGPRRRAARRPRRAPRPPLRDARQLPPPAALPVRALLPEARRGEAPRSRAEAAPQVAPRAQALGLLPAALGAVADVARR